MAHLVRLKGLAIGLAILSLVAVLLEVGPVAAGGSYEPGSAANRTVMWTGINDLLSMSQAQLAQWNDEGVGGFAASVELAPGYGRRPRVHRGSQHRPIVQPIHRRGSVEELQHRLGGPCPGDEALPGLLPRELLQHGHAIG